MTNAFSSMEYPHWLIVAGAVLLVLGFMGMALRQRVAQAEPKEMASGDEQGRSESESEPAQTQAASRKAKLEEQKRDRWANQDRSTEEPLNDRPKVGKEPQ
jgi:flagellar biosynthesis/type III secretory pathway M-ring protein FliF/YscJ